MDLILINPVPLSYPKMIASFSSVRILFVHTVFAFDDQIAIIDTIGIVSPTESNGITERLGINCFSICF